MKFFLALLSLLTICSQSTYAQDVKGPIFTLQSELSASCHYNKQKEFVFEGDIGREAYHCFRDVYIPGTEVIRITSNGGLVAHGIIIANILKQESFHLIIEKRCMSACAIYIVPLASELSVPIGSGIILHGAPSKDTDDSPAYKRDAINKMLASGYTTSEAEQELNESFKYTDIQIAEGNKIKALHNIHDGWFMESRKWSDNIDQKPIGISAESWLNDNDVNGFLVDRRFLETCLPDVKIKEFHGPSHPSHITDSAFQSRIVVANLTVRKDAMCLTQ